MGKKKRPVTVVSGGDEASSLSLMGEAVLYVSGPGSVAFLAWLDQKYSDPCKSCGKVHSPNADMVRRELDALQGAIASSLMMLGFG